MNVFNYDFVCFYLAGNLVLHAITNQGHYELRIDLKDFKGYSRFAKYRVFRVKHSKELYELTVAGYSGDAGTST